YLAREMDLHTQQIGAVQPVTQVHLGGGSPTFLSDPELRELMAMMRRSFAIAPGAECSIEIDPRTVNAERLQTIAELGFNRISADLPTGGGKIAMLSQALSAFLAADYVYVGMDHFALPNDALAVAKRQGRLHRNFQGYSTQPDCDLIGLGVSAIGKIGATYSQ